MRSLFHECRKIDSQCLGISLPSLILKKQGKVTIQVTHMFSCVYFKLPLLAVKCKTTQSQQVTDKGENTGKKKSQEKKRKTTEKHARRWL